MIPFAALDAAVALFKRFRVLIALAPVLALCGALWVQLHGFLWIDGAIEQRDKARAQIGRMETASKEARAAQIALNQTNQELSQRIAADATLRHTETSRAVNAAIDAYIDRGRGKLQNYCGSGTGQTALPSGPDAPDSPDADEVLAVPRRDFESLASDALRGAEARAFLIDLINEGLAVQN